MQIEKLLEEQEKNYYTKFFLGSDNLTREVFDWHKQSLKQFIDGLVEIEEKTLYQDKPKHGSWQEGWNDAKKDAILHLKEIRKQLE